MTSQHTEQQDDFNALLEAYEGLASLMHQNQQPELYAITCVLNDRLHQLLAGGAN